MQGSPNSTCGGTTLGAGGSCVINVVFVPTGTSQAQRNANLSVTVGGVTQTVALSGHDTIATVTVSALTPALTATPANTVAVTGTRTITNTSILCVTATCTGGANPDAGPYVITAITLTKLSGNGTFVLGGTCTVGTPINAGANSTPPVAGGTCTVTVTYTPPTTGPLTGSAHLTVAGYGTASTAALINANFNAN
jgi:hypothetical protein